MSESQHNLINGEWLPSSDGATFAQLNPADLDTVTAHWPKSPSEDAVRAIEAAQAAFPGWAGLGVYRRAEHLAEALRLMGERRDAIAAVLTAENGKTIRESLTEIDAARKEMDFQIQEGLRLCGRIAPSALDGVLAYETRAPLGVVSIISPWNFPFNVPGRKVTPALMAGNTAVLKPASLTPGTAREFIRLFADAGLPPGVLNFVCGGGSTVGETLTTHPLIKAISFTGSTEVGKQLNEKACGRLIRTQLELGGKNPMVVLGDADLDGAANAAVTAAYACAGQWCTSTSRLIVTNDIADAMVTRVVEGARALRVGPGTDPETTMGPVCGKDQLDNILAYVDIGEREGATLLTGGRRITADGLDRGCFIEPAVFDHVTPDMRIAQEEIFGPVLSVIRVSDFEEAVAVANGVEFGLASSIYTRDLEKAMRFLEATEVGLTHVNLITALKEPQLTFGGVKASGYGIPEAGKTGIEFFTEHKTAYVKFR